MTTVQRRAWVYRRTDADTLGTCVVQRARVTVIARRPVVRGRVGTEARFRVAFPGDMTLVQRFAVDVVSVGTLPRQVPPAVHALLSSHGVPSPSSVCPQVPFPSHLSAVHGLPSPEQATSLPFGVSVHPPLPLHTLLSTHSDDGAQL